MQNVCLFYTSRFSSRTKVTIIQSLMHFNGKRVKAVTYYETLRGQLTQWGCAWVDHCIILILIREPLMHSSLFYVYGLEVILVICHRHGRIKAANVFMYLQWTCFISPLLLSLSMSLIECRWFCMIYPSTSRLGNASRMLTHRHKYLSYRRMIRPRF